MGNLLANKVFIAVGSFVVGAAVGGATGWFVSSKKAAKRGASVISEIQGKECTPTEFRTMMQAQALSKKAEKAEEAKKS